MSQRIRKQIATRQAWLSESLSIPSGSVTTSELGGDITTAAKAFLDDATASEQQRTLKLSRAKLDFIYG